MSSETHRPLEAVEQEARELLKAYQKAETAYLKARLEEKWTEMRGFADQMEWLRYSMGRPEFVRSLLDGLNFWRNIAAHRVDGDQTQPPQPVVRPMMRVKP